MITVDVYKNVGEDVPFDVETFTADTKDQAMKIFQRELRNLSISVKYPKYSDKNGLVQVRTNRGRIIGEIEVSK